MKAVSDSTRRKLLTQLCQQGPTRVTELANYYDVSLNAISKYLNGMKTATGEFTQINDDGTISTGQIYIKRPGRVRFEYNPPEKTAPPAKRYHSSPSLYTELRKTRGIVNAHLACGPG